MTTPNIKALAARAKELSDKALDSHHGMGDPLTNMERYELDAYSLKAASALLRVLEDAERLCIALRRSEIHVRATAEAAHLTDGFSPKLHPMDDLVSEVTNALESHEKLMEELGGD